MCLCKPSTVFSLRTSTISRGFAPGCVKSSSKTLWIASTARVVSPVFGGWSTRSVRREHFAEGRVDRADGVDFAKELAEIFKTRNRKKRELLESGECGEMFRRIHWNNRGCKSIVWRCISRLEPTGQECHARIVNEMVLENVVVQAINTLLGDKSTYQAQLQQNIANVIRSAQQKTADGIDDKLQELQKELLKKANNKEAYDKIADEIFKLREQHEKCTVAFVLWT